MKIFELETSKFIYPTTIGMDQDRKDQDYADILEEITKAPKVAVVNIVNNEDGTFHTIGFMALMEDYVFEDNEDDTRANIRDDIEYSVYLESNDGREYDLGCIFNEDDYSIEIYDTTTDIQKVTEYMDALFEASNFDVTITDCNDEFNEGEDFVNAVISMNESLNVAVAECLDGKELVLIAAENIEDFEIKTIDNLPILFTDLFKNINFSKIGSIMTKDDVLKMPYASDTLDYESVLRDSYGSDWYDGNNENEDENPYPYEGPSGVDKAKEPESEEGFESESEPDKVFESEPDPETPRAVEKVVINTPAFEAAKIQNQNTRVQKTTTSNLKEEKPMNLFAKLNFKPVTAAITFDGLLAIDTNTDPKLETQYKAVSAEGDLIDVLDDTIAMELPLLMPVMGQAPEIGDYVQQGGVWYKILSDKTALNMTNGTTAGLKMTFTQFFKSCVFYRAMINPANMMSNGLMMAMLLNGEAGNSNFDMKTLMMLSMMNGQNQDFMKSPMFLMFLMGDQKEGGFDMKTLMLMQMFNGGANPFASFLNSAAPADTAATAPATAAKPAGKRK